MIKTEDISSISDNEIEASKLLKIKNISKENIAVYKKIRIIKKISYLTKNTMQRYKNKLVFDLTKKVLNDYLFSTKTPFSFK